MVSGKKIAAAVSVTALVAGLSYMAYFDYKRRNDRQFRRKLRRDRKKVEKTASKISEPSLDEVSDQALELLGKLANEPLPSTPEDKEQFFMAQVSKGEALSGSGASGYAEAACCFFQALKVYPNPVELVMIYQKTTPDAVFKLVMAMMTQEVKQKQARYFDVFPSEDKHVRIKDKNKMEGKTKFKESQEGAKSDVVVPNRALFATRGVEAGEVVYEEESVVSALLPCAQNGKFCYHCLRAIPEKAEEKAETESTEDKVEETEPTEEKAEETEPTEEIKPAGETKKSSAAFECEKCHDAVYCTEKCRQDAYDAYHQFLCPTSSSSTAREFAELTQKSHELAPILIAKFFGTLVDREKKKEIARALGVSDKSDTDEYTTWEHLEIMRYLELIPTASDATALHKLGEVMSASVPGLNEFVTGERYTMLKGKLDYNAFSVHTEGVVPKETPETHVSDTMRDDHSKSAVGISMYLISSHIAHNCDPNVQIVFPDGTDKAAIKALKSIAVDEELRISYVDPSLGVEERRKQLQALYRVKCECKKCEADLAAAKAEAEAAPAVEDVEEKAAEAVEDVEEKAAEAVEDKAAEEKANEAVKTIDPSDEGTPSFAAVAASPSPVAAVEAKTEETEEADTEEAESDEFSDDE
ncbi:mitochondrial import receptor subunit tom20 [Coemansia sp. RSA 2131]|nr:mitochondrial import receptor subunit tom20 [Coemansia sp. RSA 2131]